MPKREPKPKWEFSADHTGARAIKRFSDREWFEVQPNPLGGEGELWIWVYQHYWYSEQNDRGFAASATEAINLAENRREYVRDALANSMVRRHSQATELFRAVSMMGGLWDD